ncbi:hypothetical protein MUP77_17200 [Candidatus Bathyarchaeota archaeon]|nr:hypothetical protein [Candidatus Bathyarchaeota archaeon]
MGHATTLVAKRALAHLRELGFLEWVLILTYLGFNFSVLIPWSFIYGVTAYGYYFPLLILATQAPIEYYIIREIIRQIRSLPQSEAFEISQERWNKALDYILRTQKKH